MVSPCPARRVRCANEAGRKQSVVRAFELEEAPCFESFRRKALRLQRLRRLSKRNLLHPVGLRFPETFGADVARRNGKIKGNSRAFYHSMERSPRRMF